MSNNLFAKLFLCFVTILQFCQQSSEAYYWPQPGSLIFFTPLDAENGLNDIAKNIGPSYTDGPLLETSKPGPFAIADSSYTVQTGTGKYYITGYHYQPSLQSFTFSTYFYVSGNQQKGAVFYSYMYNSANKFSILYNGNSLEIHRFGSSGDWSIASFTVSNFFNNGWTWICFTFDNSSNTVTLYNEVGEQIYIEKKFPILDLNTTQITLGYGHDNSTTQYMTNGDAMACTMIYNQVLYRDEIAQLPNVCYWKGKQPTSWPKPENLIGLWPLSDQYKFNTIIGADHFDPVSFQLFNNSKINFI